MVIQVLHVKEKRRNYFMTYEEAKILWQYSKKWGTKWQVLVGLCLFRGMRIGEAVAVNIFDFQNENFNKLNVILQKSHVKDEFPILGEFNELLREYILKNKHTMKDGFLFPYYSSRRNGTSHMDANTADTLFCKLRRQIAKDHPEFMDRHDVPKVKYLVTKLLSEGVKDRKRLASALKRHDESIYRAIKELFDKGIIDNNMDLTEKGKAYLANGDLTRRYRIGFHSCRRWFETTIWNKYKDKMQLRDIMRYSHSKTVDTYIDSYEVWKNEGKILDETFKGIYQDFNNLQKGQSKLTKFFT